MDYPKASIDATAEIGRDVRIGPFAVIGAHARIGDGSVIHDHAWIGPNTILGRRNAVYPFAGIGGDPQDLSWRGEETWLEVGEENVFREAVTVSRGTPKDRGRTVIGSHNYLMACSHVAHDCVLEDHVVMANAVLLGGHVRVEPHVWFGGMVAVHHYVTVGRHAFIGGLTRITTDVPPYMLLQGLDGRVRSVNRVGLRRRGFGEGEIAALQEAYRLLFRQRLGVEEAHQRLEGANLLTEEVRYLLAFLERKQGGLQGRCRQPEHGT